MQVTNYVDILVNNLLISIFVYHKSSHYIFKSLHQ